MHSFDSILAFDPKHHVAPATLFRWLTDGAVVRLVDLRTDPNGLSFAGAVRDEELDPSIDPPTLYFDQDGSLARRKVADLRGAGCEAGLALYGGIDLYDFALDPLVVGSERFLVRVQGRHLEKAENAEKANKAPGSKTL